jgi:hypothetical protein
VDNDDIPPNVWMIATELSGGTRYAYAGTETKEEAFALAAVHAMGEPVSDAKLIKNVEGVRTNEWRTCPIGIRPASWEG